MVGLPVRNPREGGGGSCQPPPSNNQQAHQSNDVLAHWFLCRAHTNASVMRPARPDTSLSGTSADQRAHEDAEYGRTPA